MRRLVASLAATLIFSGPALAGISYLVVDNDSNTVITANDDYQIRPIASLTKMMTALVTVESGVNLYQKVPYRGRNFRERMVSRIKLLEALMIRSDNHAAEALARSWPLGRDRFIDSMNMRAQELGMFDTTYQDPSGLDNRNQSTAHDLSILVRYLSRFTWLNNISSSLSMPVEKVRRKKIFYVNLSNTNTALLFKYPDISFSKTGTTSAAGKCLALRVGDQPNDYTIIILGARSSKERSEKAKSLIDNYTLVERYEI